MSHNSRVLSLVVIYIFSTLIISACTTAQSSAAGSSTGSPPWAPAGKSSSEYRFRYFPAPSVYFDIQRGIYYYQSQGRWIRSYRLPSSIKINLMRDYVVLTMDVDRPYQYHEEVLKRYPPEYVYGSKTE